MTPFDAWLRARLDIEAAPIILDHEFGAISAEIEGEGCLGGMRVLIDVGQRLLDDPKQRNRDLRGEFLAGRRSNFSLERDAGGLLELATEVEHPLADLLFLHEDRPQLVDESAHFRQHVVGLLDRTRQQRRHRARLGQREVAGMFQLESEGVDVLHQSIVHVASDSVALGHHRHLVLLVLNPSLEPKPFHSQRNLTANLL